MCVTEHPQPPLKSAVETDDQHFALKVIPEQPALLRAPTNVQWQPLGTADRVIQGQAEKQGVRGVRAVRSLTLAESLWQTPPGSLDLCARSSVGPHSLVEPSTP